MKKLMTMALVALGASLVLVASGSAAGVQYQFDGVALYQFGGPPTADFHFGPNGNPDTSFVVITNNGLSTFTGNIGFNALSGCAVDFSVSYAVTLAPSKSASVSINDEASNQCGYNGPFDAAPTAQLGAKFFMNGTVSLGPDTDAVDLSILDKDIHSGVFATNPFGVNLDNYILQGGDPFGRDTGDAFEVAQAHGPFQFVTCPSNFDFNFSDSQYTNCFRDLLSGGDINAGFAVTDLNTALNFTGSAGPTGRTWLTAYDKTPTNPDEGPTFGAETLCADVLIEKWNNTKGAGVVALLNEGVGKKGLALLVYDAGGTDTLSLAVVDPATGSLTSLAANSLFGGILENAWYRLIMTVNPTTPVITGQVFKHTTATDPNSSLGAQVGGTLTYSPSGLPVGVTSPGENGIIANANRAVVNSSVTNFTNDPSKCPVRLDP